MFRKRLRRWLPRSHAALEHPWLRRLVPALRHPRLWHVDRRGIASGVAVGLFFGILLPVGQIPSAALCAVLLRANLATAIASTFVTNPLTYVPVYATAYLLGCFLCGSDPAQLVGAEAGFEGLAFKFESLAVSLQTILDVAAPIFVGALVLASRAAMIAYFGIHGLRCRLVRRAWRRRIGRAPRLRSLYRHRVPLGVDSWRYFTKGSESLPLNCLARSQAAAASTLLSRTLRFYRQSDRRFAPLEGVACR